MRRNHALISLIPFLFLFLLGVSNQSAGGWYDPDWSERKPIIIDNTGNTNTLIDYQIMVQIPYTPEMQIDFEDIRFTVDDETTSIPYWLEEYVAADYAIAWVRVPSIAALDTTELFLYYGNPNAVSESNGEAVFDFFDDFDDQNIGDWTVLTGSWNAAEQYLRQLVREHHRRILAPYVLPDSFVIDALISYTSYYQIGGTQTFISKNANGTDGYKFGFASLNVGGSRITVIIGGSCYDMVTDPTINVPGYCYIWVKQSVRYHGQGDFSMHLLAPDSAEVFLQVFDNTFTPPFTLGAYGSEMGVDDIRVRKFTDPEPTVSIGEEQYPGNIIVDPDHADSTNTGQLITYPIYVQNQDSLEDVVEIVKQWNMSSWQVFIRDSLTGDTIIDNNGNGNPDIDTLHTGEIRFLLVDILPDDSAYGGTIDTCLIRGYFANYPAITDTSLCITKIITNASLSIEPDQSAAILPGDSIDYLLTITNNGNIRDVVDITAVQSSPSWTCDLLDSTGIPLVDHNGNWVVDIDTLLPFGTTCDIYARISAPPSANPGHVDTTRILIRFTGYPLLVDTATIITTVQAPPSDIIIEPDHSDSTDTGQLITYPIHVENRGLMEDIVEITKRWSIPNWIVTIRDSITGDTLIDHNGNGIPDLDTLRAYEIRNLLVDITPDDSAYASTLDTAIIKAYFAGDTTISDTCFTITKIKTSIILSIEPDQSSNAFPGQSIDYSLDITNSGNIKDVVDVSAIQSASGWTYNLLDSTGTPLLDNNGNWILDIDTLDGFGTSCSIIARINVATSASPGDVDTSLILARFTSFPLDVDTATLISTAISPGSSFVMIAPDHNGYVDPDSTISYQLTVWNLGTSFDVIDIAPSGTTPSWICQILDSLGNPLVDNDGDGVPDVGILAPFDSVGIRTDITAPPNATAGEIDSTLVWACSSNDTTIKDQASLTSTINMAAEVRIEPDYTDSIAPQDTVIYILTVSNLGNSNDVIDITTSGGIPSWYFEITDMNGLPLQDSDNDGNPDVGTVPPGSGIPIQAIVASPHTAVAGDTDLRTVYATSSNNQSMTDTTILATGIIGNITLFLIERDYYGELDFGVIHSYAMTAYLEGTTGDFIEVATDGPSHGWSYELLDHQLYPLPDSNGDGMAELGQMNPGDTVHFYVSVQTPTSMSGVDSLGLLITIEGRSQRFNMVDSAAIYSFIVPVLDIHNYESPFSSRTTFRFSIPASGEVYLDVYNKLGEKVRSLISGRHYQRGIHTHPWDGKNDHGHLLSPAVYYYVFRLKRNSGEEDKIIKKTAIVR